MQYLFIIIFVLLFVALLCLLKVNPFKPNQRIALTENILKEKRSRVTGQRIKKSDRALLRINTLLKESSCSRLRFNMMIIGAFLAGSAFGYLMFSSMLLSIATGIVFLPLPLLYITLKAQASERVEIERLENTMSIITLAYIGCDDIVKAVEQFNREKNRYVADNLRKITPLNEFVAETTMINCDVERALQVLSAKVNNRYFRQWLDMLTLCCEDRRLKFALMPIIDAMNDAKGMQIESDSLMAQTWRDYFFTVALMFAVIPILRFSNDMWFWILTQTFGGKALMLLMLLITLVTAFYVARFNKPVITS
jgi:hypothetical protein